MITWPNKLRTQYSYDASGRATEVRDPDRPMTEAPMWRGKSWDAFGQVTASVYWGNTEVQTATDPRTGRIVGVTSTGVTPAVARAYRYDRRGWTRQRVSGGVVEDFVPDAIGRLQSYTRTRSGQAEQALTIDYDAIGNIRGGTRSIAGAPSTAWSRTYDPANKPRAVRSTSDGETYDYDADGNQGLRTGASIVDGQQRIAYDASGMPVEISTGPEEKPASITRFSYGPDLRRVAQVARRGTSVTTTQYPFDGYISRVVNGVSSTSMSIPLPDGNSIQRTGAGQETVALADPLGSVANVLSNGNSRSAEYPPLGKSTAGQTFSPWGFAGQEEDYDLGLTNLNARLYDPSLGQFLSPDPIMADSLWGAGSASAYAYGFHAPNSFADPSGLEPTQLDEIFIYGYIGDSGSDTSSGAGRSDGSTVIVGGDASSFPGDSFAGSGARNNAIGGGWDSRPTLDRTYNVENVPALSPYRTAEELATGAAYDRSARGVLYDPRTVEIQRSINAKWQDAFLTESLLAAVPFTEIFRAIKALPAAGRYIVALFKTPAARGAGQAAKYVATTQKSAIALSKQLASEAQLGEMIAGTGSRIAGAGARAVFRDAGRIAQTYGGNAADWVKMSSSGFRAADGTTFATHWVENIVTGMKVEPKVVIDVFGGL
jgi:RHS repeat-associated protein